MRFWTATANIACKATIVGKSFEVDCTCDFKALQGLAEFDVHLSEDQSLVRIRRALNTVLGLSNPQAHQAPICLIDPKLVNLGLTAFHQH